MLPKPLFKRILILGLFLIVALGFSIYAVALARAQDPEGRQELRSRAAPADPAAVVPGAFPVQGMLSSASGQPLSGTYNVTFRLYESDISGSPICVDARAVTVQRGLFNSVVDGCQYYFTGQKVWLGIEVEGNGEMTPRQVIYPVPYALSLSPGAWISGTHGSVPMLELWNTAPTGRALRAVAKSTTGQNYGVVAASASISGFAAYVYNNGGGTGLYAESNTGTAIRAGGTGVIQSTAPSYLWVSGNGVRAYQASDGTVIDMDTIGGAFVRRGATLGNKNVMLPIAIPGTLYGQHARLTDLDIYWAGQTGAVGIGSVLLRRQTGVCASPTCYENILYSTTDRMCAIATNPTGCVTHFDLASNNVLAADSGGLYLTLVLFFDNATNYVEIGSVRLTLVYDN